MDLPNPGIEPRSPALQADALPSEPPIKKRVGRGNVERICRRSLVAQMVKHLPAMQETPVQSLGQEDSLKKEMQPTPAFLPENPMVDGAS